MIDTDCVDIEIREDDTQKREIRSIIHTYRLDNVTNPVQVLVPYNVSRIMARIINVNTSVVVGRGAVPTGTSGTVAGIAPDGESIVVNTSGNGYRGQDIYGPEQIWAQSIQGNGATLVVVTTKLYA